MQPSTQKLYNAITDELGAGKRTAKQRALLGRVVSEHYNEFRSPLAFPITQLCADLQRAKLGALVGRVKAGEFDASDDECREWANSPEGQQAFRSLAG